MKNMITSIAISLLISGTNAAQSAKESHKENPRITMTQYNRALNDLAKGNADGYKELAKIVKELEVGGKIEPAHIMAISVLMHAQNSWKLPSKRLSDEEINNYKALGRQAFLPISERALHGNTDNLTPTMVQYIQAMTKLDIEHDVEGLTDLDIIAKKIEQGETAEYAHVMAAEELLLSQNPYRESPDQPSYEEQGRNTLMAIAESNDDPELRLLAAKNILFATHLSQSIRKKAQDIVNELGPKKMI